MVANIKSPPIYRVSIYQLVTTFFLAGLLLIGPKTYALSALLGGLVCVMPSAYFARFAFKYSGAKSALRIAHSMYLGEAGKFVLTIVLFAVIFLLKVKNYLNVNIAVLFLSYILIVIIGLVSAHVILTRKNY